VFELVLVTGIVVVAAGLAIPLIGPMLSSSNLQAASDEVKARWTEMRSRAVSDGRPYRFAIMENTGKYKIAPEGSEFWGDGDDSSSDSEARPWVVEGKLPGEVHFLSSEATPTGGQSTSGHGGSGGWTRTVTFLPNGTAREDVHVSFGQAGSTAMHLELRGATGTIIAREHPGGKHK
jgi:hypothetical protein